MKILHITSHLDIGGITSYLLSSGSTLVKRGHAVAVASGGGAMTAAFRAAGIETRDFNVRTKSEIHPKLLFALPALTSYARGFDVLHAHTRVGQVLAALVGNRLKLPVVTTAHGFYKSRLGRRLFDLWGDRVVAISPLVAEALVTSHSVDPLRVRLVRNGVDAAAVARRVEAKGRAAARRELGIPDGAFVAGSISRLVEDKGHAFFLEAISLLAAGGKDAYALVQGSGRERGRLESLARERKLEGRVKFLDASPDVTPVLAAMDVFVHPATHREGFGLAMAEAMAAGRPVVATDIPAVNTIVRTGENGLLVPPSDAAALASALEGLAGDRPFLSALSEGARKTVEREASLDAMADGLERVYREVLEARRGR